MNRVATAPVGPRLFDPGHKADGELAALAKQINKSHAAVERHASDCLERARQTGALLLQAKGACGHGGWVNWLKANVKFSQQSAATYMRLARHWEQIESAGYFVRRLSIRQALALLCPGGLEKSGLVPDAGTEPEAAGPKGREEGAGFDLRDGRKDFTVKLLIALSHKARWLEMVATARSHFDVDSDGEALFRALEAWAGRGQG
jgi:hypothetical protein